MQDGPKTGRKRAHFGHVRRSAKQRQTLPLPDPCKKGSIPDAKIPAGLKVGGALMDARAVGCAWNRASSCHMSMHQILIAANGACLPFGADWATKQKAVR